MNYLEKHFTLRTIAKTEARSRFSASGTPSQDRFDQDDQGGYVKVVDQPRRDNRLRRWSFDESSHSAAADGQAFAALSPGSFDNRVSIPNRLCIEPQPGLLISANTVGAWVF